MEIVNRPRSWNKIALFLKFATFEQLSAIYVCIWKAWKTGELTGQTWKAELGGTAIRERRSKSKVYNTVKVLYTSLVYFCHWKANTMHVLAVEIVAPAKLQIDEILGKRSTN